ncbi:hypothetical protein Pelo_13013 [Pelomyxa schiedti]|nr:hypothetical protein Pelo_13013 [Pelomyxa schiedti]
MGAAPVKVPVSGELRSLWDAVASGNATHTAVLLGRGASIDINAYYRDVLNESSTSTLLHLACSVGSVSIVQLLIYDPPPPHKPFKNMNAPRSPDDTSTALSVACRLGYEEVVCEIVQGPRGGEVDVNYITAWGTPLHITCALIDQEKAARIAQTLLSHPSIKGSLSVALVIKLHGGVVTPVKQEKVDKAMGGHDKFLEFLASCSGCLQLACPPSCPAIAQPVSSSYPQQLPPKVPPISDTNRMSLTADTETPPVERLLKNDVVSELEIDVTPMPLGRLSKKQIQAGYEILRQLEVAIATPGGAPQGVVEDYTNQFNTLIPHGFPPVLISTTDLLKSRMKALTDMETARTQQRSEEKHHPSAVTTPTPAHPHKVGFSIQNANTEQVCQWLSSIGIEEACLNIIRTHKLRGRTIMSYTVQQLCALGLVLGDAELIVEEMRSCVQPSNEPHKGFVPELDAPKSPVALQLAGPELNYKCMAFVVGNESYSRLPLHNALNDAATFLSDHCKFDVTSFSNLCTLLDFANQLEQFKSKLKLLKYEGRKIATIFYFAGHGRQIAGHNFLLMTGDDSAYTEPEFDLMKFKAPMLGDVLDGIKRHSDLTIGILDACRESDTADKDEFRTRGFGGTQLCMEAFPTGCIVIYPTSPGFSKKTTNPSCIVLLLTTHKRKEHQRYMQIVQ